VQAFRPTRALDPGHVTGFVGPNGACKSTTMRVIVGLDTPDAGTATMLTAEHASGDLRDIGVVADLAEVADVREPTGFIAAVHVDNLPNRAAARLAVPDRIPQ
jgi:ABC-2 type transport system ATP-binding protein